MIKNLDYEIRKVKPEDAEQFIKLRNFVWRTAYKDIMPEEVFLYNESEEHVKKGIDSFSDNIRNDNSHFAYVAVVNNKIVGFAWGTIKSTYEQFGDDYADLVALYIHPDFQGNGIASNFKKLFEDWAKENGATKYVIGVLKDNHKARKVYEKWNGKLSKHNGKHVKLGIGYDEVFYTYDL